MDIIALSDPEFAQFQAFIFSAAGITMAPSKKALVSGRLAKRLTHHQLTTYGAYLRLLKSAGGAAEAQIAIDLLTTNETYFFREPKHFDFLRQQAMAARTRGAGLRVWSAASSSGEEAYSMAMVLADCLDTNWEVVGSDISLRVLDKARGGHYPIERTEHIPKQYLQRFCLKGVEAQQGTLLIDRKLRSRVQFMQVNLNAPLPSLGQFDLIFLRNVMIYFSGDTKREVVARVLTLLKPGGYFCIGHSESLNDISTAVKPLAPAIYRKEER